MGWHCGTLGSSQKLTKKLTGQLLQAGHPWVCGTGLFPGLWKSKSKKICHPGEEYRATLTLPACGKLSSGCYLCPTANSPVVVGLRIRTPRLSSSLFLGFRARQERGPGCSQVGGTPQHKSRN